MKHRFVNERGMTLIEMAVALAISFVSLGAFLYLALGNRAHKSSVDHGMLLKEVLTNNVIEVRAMAIRDLPPSDQCLVRDYDPLGVFRNERRVNGRPEELCNVAPPNEGTIQIIWSSRAVEQTEVTVDSVGLRVPTDIALLRQVTVAVRARNRGDNERQIQKEMTVFKR